MNKGTNPGLTLSQLVPSGVIWELAGTVVPDGWLLCDGSAVSRSQYSNLFQTIGITHGAGNGITTFNLPNRQGRITVGRDAGQAEFATIAQTGGYKDKTMSHTHSLQNHGHVRTAAGASADIGGVDGTTYAGWNGWANAQGWYTETQLHSHPVTTTGIEAANNSDGLQGWAAGDVHNGVQTTNRTGQTMSNLTNACPINNNGGTQDHTHGLENHNHALVSHDHSNAHTHADSYTTPNTNTTTESSVAQTSGNLQPYVVVNYIVKY